MVLCFFITCIALLYSEDNEETGSCSSEGCHKDLLSFEKMHSPVESDCSGCHENNGNEHPFANGNEFKLVSEQPTLCYGCHDEKGDEKIKHSPFENDVCSSCHNPHGSNSPSLLKSDKEKSICSNCHDLNDDKKSILHSPFEQNLCIECHDPHESNNLKLLKKQAPQLCYDCHSNFSDMSKFKTVHSPFNDDCSNCHETHSASKLHLLKESATDLCYSCHSDLSDLIQSSKVIHKPLTDKKQCQNCHNPHATMNSSLLIKPVNEMCLTCHNKEMKSANKTISNIKKSLKAKFQHQPVSEDGCTTCHNPHATLIGSLLKEKYETNEYVTGVIQSFQLCFKCHDTQLLEAQKTVKSTEFRNGNINLHYMHVNKDKGRNCNLCHDVHGSDNSKLIKSKVMFGNWLMPIKYTANEVGGTCAPGCHKPYTYNRTYSQEYFAAILKGKIDLDKGNTKKHLTGLKIHIVSSDGKYDKEIQINSDLTFKVDGIEPGDYLMSLDTDKMKLLGFASDNPILKVSVKADSVSGILDNLNFNYYSLKDTNQSVADNLPNEQVKETDIKIPSDPTKEVLVSFKEERGSKLTLEMKTYLQKYLIILKSNPNSKISISGHTDNRGTLQQNQQLALDRANTAAAYLMNQGIDKYRIYIYGQGSLYPVAENDTPEGRKKNNRLEIKIVK